METSVIDTFDITKLNDIKEKHTKKYFEITENMESVSSIFGMWEKQIRSYTNTKKKKNLSKL